jgi:hypothetical protein
MSGAINLRGQRFGHLMVVERSDRVVKNHTAWECRCDCGVTSIALSNNLRRGLTTSCGCVARESSRQRMTQHGETKHYRTTVEHRIWRGMLERCGNPNHISYKYYGARGIRVCDEWKEFPRFLNDMGRRPAKGMSIDRVNVSGNYEPGNCRWATPVQQRGNRRDSK